MSNLDDFRAIRDGDRKDFGLDILRKRRMSIGLSQEQMGERLEASKKTVQRIENGEWKGNDPDLVFAIADAYLLSTAEREMWFQLCFGLPGQIAISFQPSLEETSGRLKRNWLRGIFHSPVVSIYPLGTLEYEEKICEVDLVEGGRFMIKGGPSVMTAPISVTESRLEEVELHGKLKEPAALRFLESRRKRREAFLAQVKEFQFRDICPKRSLWSPQRDERLGKLGARSETVGDRILHLESLIQALNEPNYQLALLEPKDEHLCDSFWYIKQGCAVLLETWCLDVENRNVQVDLAFQHKQVIAAFESHFEAIWRAIDDICKDREKVMALLASEVSKAKRKNSETFLKDLSH